MLDKGNKISIAYGETVHKTIVIKGAKITDIDHALIVIRDGKGTVVWWRLMPFIKAAGLKAYKVAIDIPHIESAGIFIAGRTYEWGLTWYRDPTLDFNGHPIDGIVRVLVAQAPFFVAQAVARREGLTE